jgi:hypothetical protein
VHGHERPRIAQAVLATVEGDGAWRGVEEAQKAVGGAEDVGGVFAEVELLDADTALFEGPAIFFTILEADDKGDVELQRVRVVCFDAKGRYFLWINSSLHQLHLDKQS